MHPNEREPLMTEARHVQLSQQVQRFTQASWVLIGLLVLGYLSQLTEEHERAAASMAHARLANLVGDIGRTGLEEPMAGLPLPRRAALLFARFGGVFYAWPSRFYENRCYELEFLRSPGGPATLAGWAVQLGVLGLGLWLALILARHARYRAAQYIAWRRNPHLVQDIPLVNRWPAGGGSSGAAKGAHPNRVCNTHVLAVALPFRPATVATVKFLAVRRVVGSQPVGIPTQWDPKRDGIRSAVGSHPVAW